MSKNPLRSVHTVGRDLASLKKLWPYFEGTKHWIWLALVLTPIVAGIQTVLPQILRHAIDNGISGSNFDVVWMSASFYLGLVLLEYFARAGQRFVTALAVHRMILQLRRRMIDHILNLSPRYHDQSMSGALVTRATSDFDNLSESLNQGILGSIIDLSVLSGSLIGLFLLEPKIAIWMLLIMPLVGLMVTTFSRWLKRAMLDARVKIAALNAFAQECLYGSTTIKLLVAERDAQKQFDQHCEDFRQAQTKVITIDAYLFSVIDGVASITVGLILWIALHRMGVGQTTLTAGILVAAVQYINQIFEPLKLLGSKMAMLQGAFTAMDRILGILKIDDKINGSDKPDSQFDGVHFKNVSFKYGKEADSPQVLDGVNFDLKRGSSLAIVGPTGGGKSTIVKLLTKLYQGYQGQIKWGNQEVATLDPDLLRQEIAIVPQDVVIFEGTVEQNITLGLDWIDPQEVERACVMVGADQFIKNLPGQYQYELSEQGSNLSHGQRQLITFARALVRRPKLIILDEATSSIDPRSEQLIREATLKILKNNTVIVIAHRLSTIRDSDQIVVLSGGQVAETGTHDQLFESKGHYFELYTALQKKQLASPSASI